MHWFRLIAWGNCLTERPKSSVTGHPGREAGRRQYDLGRNYAQRGLCRFVTSAAV